MRKPKYLPNQVVTVIVNEILTYTTVKTVTVNEGEHIYHLSGLKGHWFTEDLISVAE
jgi:hypothetical protein